MSLALRLAVLIAFVVMAAVIITAVLNYAKFAQVTETLDDHRYAFLAEDLKVSLEASLDLGLPLSQIENAQDLIERQRQRYPEILSIAVFNAEETVLYYSARTRTGLVDALAGNAVVTLPIDGDRVAATRLVNPFGATVGGIVIRVSAASAQARDEAMLASLGTAVLAAAAVGTAAVAAVAMLLLRGVQRRLNMQQQIIASLMEQSSKADRTASSGGFRSVAAHALSELEDVERLIEDRGAHG